MFAEEIKIRSFHVGCAHQLVLPGGRQILIDPFLRNKLQDHSLEEIQGADYILITHTHFDHELDLGYFVHRYHPLVFVGTQSAHALIRYHKIPYDCVIPVYPGQTFTTKDFKLEIIGAKHNLMGGKCYDPDRDIAMEATGTAGHKECDEWGNLESVDYMLTTPSGFRMMTVSGQALWEEPFEISKEKRPDLLLRQAGVRKAGDFSSGEQISARELAELFTKYCAKVLMPFHMDVIYMKWGKEKTEAYFEEVRTHIRQMTRGTEFLFPKPWKWYQIGMSVKEDENT